MPKGPRTEPGLTDRVWDMEEVVALMDEAPPKPGRPKTCKKHKAANWKRAAQKKPAASAILSARATSLKH